MKEETNKIELEKFQNEIINVMKRDCVSFHRLYIGSGDEMIRWKFVFKNNYWGYITLYHYGEESDMIQNIKIALYVYDIKDFSYEELSALLIFNFCILDGNFSVYEMGPEVRREVVLESWPEEAHYDPRIENEKYGYRKLLFIERHTDQNRFKPDDLANTVYDLLQELNYCAIELFNTPGDLREKNVLFETIPENKDDEPE